MKYILILILSLSLAVRSQSLQIANGYLERSDYRRAIPCYEKIIEKAKLDKDLNLQVAAQNALADCYTDLGAYYKSNVLLKENLKLLNAAKSKNYKSLAETHLLIAHNFDNLFFFEDYLNHCHKYYSFINKAYPKKEIYKALYYAYIGRYYNIKFQIDKANFYTENALKIYHRNKQDANLIDIYKLYNSHCFTIRNINIPFSIRSKYVDSLLILTHQKFTFDNIKKSKTFVSATMLNFDFANGYLYKNLKEGTYLKNKTFKVLNNSLNINNNHVGYNYVLSARINILKNILHLTSKEYLKSLNECNEGIRRLSEKDLLNYGFSSNNHQIINLLRQKHLVLVELNKVNPKKEMQQKIIDNLLLMEIIWNRYTQDQINLSTDFMSIMYNENPYSFLYQAYLTMFEITKDKKYLEKIHEYDEKSKYNSLLIISSLTAKQKQEKQILYEKRKKIYLIYDDYILAKYNKSKLQFSIKNQLLKHIKQLIVFEKKSDLMKKSKIVSLTELQNKLTHKDAIVSYLRGQINSANELYVKIITKKHVIITNLNSEANTIESDYKNKIDSLVFFLQNQKTNEFKKNSYQIYKNIFYKIEKLLPKGIEHIEIIPNAELSNLPFEMLLNADSKINDFRKLPYLIHKYNFSYSLSSSITKLNNTKRGKSFEKMTVFSPSFEEQKLTQLQLSKDKGKSIANKFNASFFDNKKANLKAFKNALQENKIISVFSHGQSFNDFENNNKGIYFSDGFLSLSEIYNLKSNCDFLLLGACETGLGGKDNGEGNINLARAFSSIGVKSMLLASWKIDEESTIKITENFLKNLQDGYTKSEALQKAKLEFLNNANPRNANPFYWAGLNIIGNNENIKPKPTQNYFWWLLLIFPISGAIWYYKKRQLN